MGLGRLIFKAGGFWMPDDVVMELFMHRCCFLWKCYNVSEELLKKRAGLKF